MGRLPDGHAAFRHGERYSQNGQEDRSREIESPPGTVVILGGFLGGSVLYHEMAAALESLTGRQAFIVPVTRGEWLRATTSPGWERILRKLSERIQAATEVSQGDRVTLVGHSAGGVMGRLFLSPEPFRGVRFNGRERIRHLITLGSPHGNAHGARLRRWVDRRYPGAFFFPEVRYTTVAGKSIQGDLHGGLKGRIVHLLYRQLSGDGGEWGDGIVPLTSARLDGARNLVLNHVAHAPMGGRPWYGTPAVVKEWWRGAWADPAL